MAFQLLKLRHQSVDFCSRDCFDLLHKWRKFCVGFCRRPNLHTGREIASFPSNSQLRDDSLEVRQIKFHETIPSPRRYHSFRKRISIFTKKVNECSRGDELRRGHSKTPSECAPAQTLDYGWAILQAGL